MGKYICQRPIHPGELLKEETEERKLSQRRLAEQMGISYKVLNDILNCRRPITTQTAMLFEAALGISASLLMQYAAGGCRPLFYGASEAGTQVCRHAVTHGTLKVSRPTSPDKRGRWNRSFGIVLQMKYEDALAFFMILKLINL